MRTLSAESVLERLKVVLETASDSALARALDATPQTISSWKKRDSVPYAKCVSVARESGVSLDWLLTGEGTMYKSTPPPDQSMQALTPKERALLEMFKELSEKDQREICRDAEEKKRLADMELQLKAMALKLEQLNSTG